MQTGDGQAIRCEARERVLRHEIHAYTVPFCYAYCIVHEMMKNENNICTREKVQDGM